MLTRTLDGAKTKYYYGPDRLLGVDDPTEGTGFYLQDALRSVVDITRSDGSLMASYKYDAWGNYREEVDSGANPFGFTGHEHDDETGLIYAKARFYDPELGLFSSEDPFVGEIHMPPSLQKYLYLFGNPSNGIDPDGRERVEVAPTNEEAEEIQRDYQRAVDRVKETPAGADAMKRLEENENFTLTVTYDPNYTTGAKVDSYECDEGGNVVGATLTVGPNFDRRISNEEQYPYGSQMTRSRDRKAYAAAHEEVGHGLQIAENPEYVGVLLEKEQLAEKIKAQMDEAKERFPGQDQMVERIREYQRLLREEDVDLQEAKRYKHYLERSADDAARGVLEEDAAAEDGELSRNDVEAADETGLEQVPEEDLSVTSEDDENMQDDGNDVS